MAAKVNGARVTCLFLEEPRIVAAHELEATAEIWLDPAFNILQTLREGSPAVPEPLIGGNHVIVPKSLDDHEQHVSPIVQEYSRNPI